MGLRLLPDLGASAGRAPRHRQGIPTQGLLARVLVNKFADHLPLYRQEAIFGRAGVELQPLVDALKREILSRSVLHADETPVQML